MTFILLLGAVHKVERGMKKEICCKWGGGVQSDVHTFWLAYPTPLSFPTEVNFVLCKKVLLHCFKTTCVHKKDPKVYTCNLCDACIKSHILPHCTVSVWDDMSLMFHLGGGGSANNGSEFPFSSHAQLYGLPLSQSASTYLLNISYQCDNI